MDIAPLTRYRSTSVLLLKTSLALYGGEYIVPGYDISGKRKSENGKLHPLTIPPLRSLVVTKFATLQRQR